jgi:hypothetical protein
MKPRVTTSTIVISLIGLGAVALVAANCSLGEGATPDCNPDADPNDINADPPPCHQVADCDDGQGWPRPEDRCCAPYATNVYERCSAIFTEDFRTNCGAGSTDGCCQAAQNDFDLCMAGLLADGTGGNTGTGGTGTTGGAGGT